MAAPEYVPQPAIQHVRNYSSPPRRPGSWRAVRPGDLNERQPRGERLGAPGPDQGYVYVLARRFADRLQLAEGEHAADAIAGCVAVALKRASLFGRAPVMVDLTVAFTLWGYLGEAPDDLVKLRRRLFMEVSSSHHYAEQRNIADMVPESTLRMTPEQVVENHQRDWRSLVDLPEDVGH